MVTPAYNVNNDPALSKAWLTLTYGQQGLASDRVATCRVGHDMGGPPANRTGSSEGRPDTRTT